MLKRKIEKAEKNPTWIGKPMDEIKNIEALSLIPRSPKEIEGINDFTNNVSIPQSRKAISRGLLAKPAVKIPYCKAITEYNKIE